MLLRRGVTAVAALTAKQEAFVVDYRRASGSWPQNPRRAEAERQQDPAEHSAWKRNRVNGNKGVAIGEAEGTRRVSFRSEAYRHPDTQLYGMKQLGRRGLGTTADAEGGVSELCRAERPAGPL